MKKLLIVGLPFFPHKYQYVLNSYQNIGVDVKVLLNSEVEDDNSSLNERFYYAGNSKVKRLYSYLKVLFEYRPKNIDCYDYSIFSIFYILIARIFRINVRFWLIGGELVGDKQDSNKDSFILKCIINTKMYLSRICLRFANVIYAKEKHHISTIKKINPKLLKKVEQIYNCVPVSDKKPIFIKNKKNDFLYANAVIEKRNVISLIYSLSDLRDKGSSFSAAIYGFNSISNDVYAPRGIPYSQKVLDLHNKLKLNDCVKVYGFVKNIKEVMTDYKFFVLPGEVILANYALLEAMSFGLVPIIYPGDGYEVMIEDGINGIVAHDFNLVEAMERALALSETEYITMSAAAFDKIKTDFSLDIWKEKLSKHLI
ncbi:glycosyltransferase family 4 protein [Acinetobacter towneri]|uniref:glycosyltransferase n=1 Tax=Acinetobacter towneri TaxID=202956 RepID=UPI00188A5CBE|nr:glycosyltransferase [Acinetobacter towneri]MBF4521341.1 glycosyltransferase family 4 protein [Acinetobacter towneri]